jgi:endonuclease YncB( thermonuclease family)
MAFSRSILGASVATFVASSAYAEVAQRPVFEVPQVGVAFATGDTWTQNGQTFRLYGVQSCIRGTTFTNPMGAKSDCGEASIAYLAAVIRDTRPRCAPVAQIGKDAAMLVVCSAHVGSSTLDLGTILITEGFAFAAFTSEAKPVYMPYLVAENLARKSRAGLWAAPDLPHPNSVLFKVVQGGN